VRGPGKDELFALEAVARQLSGAWQSGDHPPDAYLTIGGRQIAVEIAVLAPPSVSRKSAAAPRLRYDRVALQFLRDIRGGLRQGLASGETAIVAVRAPILQSGKTAAALAERIRLRRVSRSRTTEIRARAYGNRISVRIARNAWGRGPEVIGFVHSAGSSPSLILNAAQTLLDCLAKGAAAASERPHWLVLRGDAALGKTFRNVCLQISRPTGFEKILLVDARGRVEALAG